MANSIRIIALLLTIVSLSLRDVQTSKTITQEKFDKLLVAQEKIIGYLKLFIDKQSERAKKGEKIVQEYEMIAKKAREDPKEITDNPFNAFLMLKQQMRDFIYLFNSFIPTEDTGAILRDMSKNVEKLDREDYAAVAIDLFSLDDSHSFSSSEIRQGDFGKLSSFRPLNAADCQELGRLARDGKDYEHAIRWLNEALSLTESEGDKTGDKTRIINDLADSHFQQGNFQRAIELFKILLSDDPDNDYLKETFQKYQKALAEKSEL